MKRLTVLILIIFAIFFLVIQNAFTTQTISSSINPKLGKVIISVLEKYEHTPIENATICIIETKEYFQTSKLGSSQPIELNTSSSYTLLIYKNGYFSHIYHGLTIMPNITKTGIVINLEAYYMEANFQYTESFEFPPKSWSNEIIDKYKKETY